MGWGTSLYSEIYFDRKTLDTKSKVEDALESVRDSIQHCRRRLKYLVLMTEPSKFFSDPTIDMINYLNNEVDELLEWYDDLVVEERHLMQLLDEWDLLVDDTGKIIRREIKVDNEDTSDHYTVPILTGDFINLVYKDGELVKE